MANKRLDSVLFNEFNPHTDNWENYIDRLDFCFEANNITEDTAKRANFFTVCGAQVFETCSALITPKKPSEVTFKDIVKILTKHYSPQTNEISASFAFYKRDQKRDEKAADYIAHLRRLSSRCKFTDLERMLRDRLVCGMSDVKLQYDLLKKNELEYKDVVDAMLAAESAGKDVRMIHSTTKVNEHAGADYGDRAAAAAATGGASSDSAMPEPMDVNALHVNKNMRLCYRCGDRHGGECRFINATCHFCHKKGHLAKICSKKRNSNRKINFADNNDDDEDVLNGIYSVPGTSRVPPYKIHTLVAGEPVVFQLDTGAGYTIANKRTWEMLRPRLSRTALQPVSLHLRTWTNAPVKLLGQAIVPVEYNDIKQNLTLVVAQGDGPNLLGRDWLDPLGLRPKINAISEADVIEIDKLVTKHKEVFKDGLGTYCGKPVTIHVKPEATPKFLKARPVPYAIKDRVEAEIDRLVNEGVLRPVSFSEWATPVVPIVKKTGAIRLCGDYRSTVNQATESDTYPMPTANEVFAIVAGSKFFTTLDLDRAYTQVTVDDKTAKLLTLNTCKGLYTVHRLAFGVKASPGIFQRLMTSLLAGISGVTVLIDDILVCGDTMQQMQQRLDSVLARIEQAGLRLNKDKCKWAKERVEFLGFVIDAEGIHPSSSKVEAIKNTPAPKNKQELQAFLGLYNFYERFIPHKATILEPLHRLLDKTKEYQWTSREQKAFEVAKHQLTSDLTLVHYDMHKPVVLTCDSSEYGVGAVLAHVMDDGQERPIAMSSRTLHTHERRYSQLDKEAAAINFGIQKFHNYLMGRFFTIVTDHKPLLGIFDPKKPMPRMLSPRLTRIAIALTSHDYQITYKPGPQIGSADSLSRWPQPVPDKLEPHMSEILLMAETPQDFPFDAVQIEEETRKDKILTRVIHYVQRGWPNKVTDSDLRIYWLHRSELSIQEGCLLLGCRVIIPTALQAATLRVLHSTHNGIVHTKSLARSYVWWPEMNTDIEKLINGCTQCLENRHMPPKTTHKWITPSRPWSRIHADFAGPFQNKIFLIIVDAYSRWPEVFIVNNMTSATVIRHLRNLFATHGLCEIMVSDNGTPFVSAEMKEFLESNKIKQVTTAPYHPATNGLAERMVQTVKDKLRKMGDLPWDVKLPRMLLGLRVTPCSGTNKTPAELLMNRRLRTLLDTVHPDNLKNRKLEEQVNANASRKQRESTVGQSVMYRNFASGPRWIPGKVIEKSGPSSYTIENDEGVTVNRHIDQLVKLNAGGESANMHDNLREEEAAPPSQADDSEQPTLENSSQNYDDVLEIPSPEHWAEMLGIPQSNEPCSTAGKIKNKLNVHVRSPYDRPIYKE